MIACNLWCKDCQCQNKDKSSERNFVIDFESEKEAMDQELVCPNNENSSLKFLGTNPVGGYVKISSSSLKDKRAYFKNRSHEHYKKKVKDVQTEMNRESYNPLVR